MIGAISRVSTCRHSYRVANAADPSWVSGPSQNRRRDRRTYQFDRSSMNAASRRPAAAVSKPSMFEVTSCVVACSSLSSQRSSSGRSWAGGASAACAGLHARPWAAAALAYSTRNETVFQ